MITVVLDRITDREITSGIASFLNPHSYMELRGKTELLSELDAIYIDGGALVLALRLLGVRVRRRSFDMSSLAPSVLKEACKARRRVYFIGGQSGVAERAAAVVSRSIGDLDVICHHGYLSTPSDTQQIIDKVSSTPGALVIVGMGAVLQEQFLVHLKRSGWRGLAFSCGGFFHQTASTRDGEYYPALINRLGLRWAYRIYDEPRLFWRYAFVYPLFVQRFVRDVVQYRRTSRQIALECGADDG